MIELGTHNKLSKLPHSSYEPGRKDNIMNMAIELHNNNFYINKYFIIFLIT